MDQCDFSLCKKLKAESCSERKHCLALHRLIEEMFDVDRGMVRSDLMASALGCSFVDLDVLS